MSVFCRNYVKKDYVFTIFQNEKTPFTATKKKNVQKVEKIDIFPKGLTHGFVPQMAIFPTFFLGNIGQENFFYDILERKNAFLGYKNKMFKKSKNEHFFKGFNPQLWSKMTIFPTFVQANIGQESVFYNILERKNPFLEYKNKKFKKSKK